MRSNDFAPLQLLEPYMPQEHQIKFHQSTAKYRALVSGVGAGKTRMGVEEIKKMNALYPGGLWVIGRLTSKSLKETTERRFFECVEPRLIAKHNKQEGKAWLYTGRFTAEGRPIFTEILFAHLDEPGQLGSLDISGFWIDEAHEPDGAEVPEAVFQMLGARLRHPVGPWRGMITSNSGGHDWVWKRFFAEDYDSETYEGWNVPTSANARYLPKNYERDLRRDNPKTWCDRFLDGSFDAFEGQIFPDFDDKCIKTPNEIKIMENWQKGGGFDFGISAPTAAEFCAVTPDGTVVVYDEEYEPNAYIDKFARRVMRRGYDCLYADPSVVNRGPDKKSPKMLYANEGLYLMEAPNDIDFFITYTTQLIRAGKLIISSRCKHLIAQIKAAAWNPSTLAGTSLKEQIKVMPNHALDAFKYFVNTLGYSDGILPIYNPANLKKLVVPKFIHPSYADDLDFDKADYVHEKIKQQILGSNV